MTTPEYNRFTTLSPATIDELAHIFDATTLNTMYRAAEQLASRGGPAAQAWLLVAGTVAQAHEQRAYDEQPCRP